MSASARWEDLAVRVVSAIVLAAIGAAVIWAGGFWLTAFVSICAGAMIWEAATMTAPERRTEALVLALLAGGLLVAIIYRHDPVWLALLFVPAIVGAIRSRKARWGYFGISSGIMFAAYGMIAFREAMGLAFVVWVVAVVAVVDLAGYFGGRMIGGPKFWPRISPKKTWSGTISGWVGAAAVGAVFVVSDLAPLWTIPFSALLGFASQMGDISESALKRKVGVKDASKLIPGHGGVMDRFDGLAGGLLFLLVWGNFFWLPGVGA
jgi:phosphatidate cytidylyltransferase